MADDHEFVDAGADLHAYLAARRMEDGRCGRASMRNYILKSLLATMVARFSPEEVVEFWTQLPFLIEGRPAAIGARLRLLWDPEKTTSKEFVARALCGTERYLVRRGYDVPEFIRNLSFRINKGTPVPGRALMEWIEPLAGPIYDSVDLHHMVLKLMCFTSDKFIPGSLRKIVKVEQGADTKDAWVVFAPDKKLSIVWPYHSDLIGLSMFSNAPRVLGLPPFGEIETLADTGSVENVLWDARIEVSGKRLLIDGEAYGEMEGFRDWWARTELQLVQPEIPDVRVAVMHRPYYCPLRRREVLHLGCAYGAPFWLSRVRFPSKIAAKRTALRHVVRDFRADPDPALEARFAAVLALVPEVVEFTLLRHSQLLLLGGERLTTGTPALMLAILLQQPRVGGKAVMSLGDMSQHAYFDGVIGLQPEIALDRAAKALEKAKCPVRILRSRGVRVLEADCPIRFEEREPLPGRDASPHVSTGKLNSPG